MKFKAMLKSKGLGIDLPNKKEPINNESTSKTDGNMENKNKSSGIIIPELVLPDSNESLKKDESSSTPNRRLSNCSNDSQSFQGTEGIIQRSDSFQKAMVESVLSIDRKNNNFKMKLNQDSIELNHSSAFVCHTQLVDSNNKSDVPSQIPQNLPLVDPCVPIIIEPTKSSENSSRDSPSDHILLQVRLNNIINITLSRTKEEVCILYNFMVHNIGYLIFK